MITLTDKALAKVKEMMSQSPESGSYLRVAVIGGGCSGFQYQLTREKTYTLDDHAIHCGDLEILVDHRSATYLSGTEIDYLDDLTKSGFQFKNPNAHGSCGCGESFTV